MVTKLNSWQKIKISSPQILLVMGLSALGVLTGVTPQYDSLNHQLTRDNQVLAQNISNDELQRYARAAVEIERLRQTTFAKVEGIVGKGQSNQLACHQQESISQLPTNARTMVTDYCQTSEGIVRKNGLSIHQFNQITQQVRESDELKNRLKEITRQL